jgi:hypothetical protein
MTGRQAQHQKIIAEGHEEEGRIENADAEKAESAGLICQAEEMVEKGFQGVDGCEGAKVPDIERKGNQDEMVWEVVDG